ncbi:MAG: hypothetical protein MZV63_70225 [Marinilabiliales bacterium]|nr:hypothetical protein [Marinilabiliales bacterium]
MRRLKGKWILVNENRINFTADEQADGATVAVEGKVLKKRNPLIVTGEYLVRALLGVRIGKSDLYIIAGTVPCRDICLRQNFWGCQITMMSWLRDGHFILGYSDKNFFDKAVIKRMAINRYSS